MDTTLVTTPDIAYSGAGLHRDRLGADLASSSTAVGHRWALVASLAVPAVWIDLFVVARAVDRSWFWLVAIAGQTLAAASGAALLRRAATGSLFGSRRANRAAGHLLGSLLLLPYTVFAEQHRQARMAARRADGSTWGLDGTALTGFAVDADARGMAGYGAWPEAARILIGEKHLESHSRSQIRSALIGVVGCAWMATVFAVGLRFAPAAWLVSWLLPLVLGTALTVVLGIAVRGRRQQIDRRTNAFELIPTGPAQEMVPASRSMVISAGS